MLFFAQRKCAAALVAQPFGTTERPLDMRLGRNALWPPPYLVCWELIPFYGAVSRRELYPMFELLEKLLGGRAPTV